MPKAPKISIVIPVYNGERYIVECIESVYQQTYSDFEIIVIDDASTDRTQVIVEQLQDSYWRLRYFRNEKNLGAGGSRNVGIRESKADRVAFLDADDRWYPAFLETQVRILNANPDIDCLFCDFDLIDEASNVTDISSGRYVCQDASLPLCRIDIKSIWTGRGPMPMCHIGIFKKSALFDVGLFPDGYCEDINLWIRFAVKHRFAETGLILASYRKHQAQKTGDGYRFLLGRTDAYQNAVRAYQEIRRLVGPKIFAEVMHRHTTLAGNYWFWKQDYTHASKYFWQAYRYKPSDLNTLVKLAWCWTPSILKRPARALKNAWSSS